MVTRSHARICTQHPTGVEVNRSRYCRMHQLELRNTGFGWLASDGSHQWAAFTSHLSCISTWFCCVILSIHILTGISMEPKTSNLSMQHNLNGYVKDKRLVCVVFAFYFESFFINAGDGDIR